MFPIFSRDASQKLCWSLRNGLIKGLSLHSTDIESRYTNLTQK